MNKKKYCLIIPDFRGIGGAQLYALRRLKHLNERSISVLIIVGTIDDKLIKKEVFDVPIFENHNLLQLAFDIKGFKRKAILESFLRCGHEGIELFESYDTVGSTWGEYFANELNCRHFIYSLVEPPLYRNKQDKPTEDFYKFKLKRGELIGLSSVSLEKIFGKKFDDISNKYVNVPFDTSELTERSQTQFHYEIAEGSFVIGTLSRLEKSYVEVLILETIKVSQVFPDSKFSLIIAGNSVINDFLSFFKIKYINNASKPANLEIILPGYIRPLGKDFFLSLDVFVGMGTGAVSAISQGCATIAVDPLTNLSSGVFGVETNNFAYSETGIQYSISESIKDIFNNRDKLEIARVKGLDLFENEFRADICFKKLDGYILSSYDVPSFYWEINKIGFINSSIRFLYRNRNKSVIRVINWIRHRMLG